MLYQPTRHLVAAQQAARMLATFRRVSHVRIDPAAGRAVVVGVRHRLPAEVVVPIEVAEAMRAHGIAAIVRSTVAS